VSRLTDASEKGPVPMSSLTVKRDPIHTNETHKRDLLLLAYLSAAPSRVCALAKLPTSAAQSEGRMLAGELRRAARLRKRKSCSSHTRALTKALTIVATCGGVVV
jgi:hypothetical protein